MTGPRLGMGMPTNDGWIAREFADLRRQITELRAARTLDASTIGSGGITVVDDGTITIGGLTDEQIVLDASASQGRLAFLPTGNPSDPATVTSVLSLDGLTAGINLMTSAAGPVRASVAMNTTSGIAIEAHTEPGADYTTDILLTPSSGIRGSVIALSVKDATNTTGMGIFSGGTGDPTLECGTVAWAFPTATVEWKAVAAGGAGAYIPVLASAFTVSSSETVKERIESIPFDALDAVENAPAMSWRYKSDHAVEDHCHIGPMAEALPDELVQHRADGGVTVDLLSLVGVLWDAVGKLSARVAELSP